jgi:hypothetical protein
MGMSLDGVIAKCSFGSGSPVSMTDRASRWIVLGETPHC